MKNNKIRMTIHNQVQKEINPKKSIFAIIFEFLLPWRRVGMRPE
jgi:hypothetical protein